MTDVTDVTETETGTDSGGAARSGRDLSSAKDMIVCEGVSKWYGNFQALEGVSATIKEQEVVVVLGPSGSGKSTWIRCINRLEEHQEGLIVVDGVELSNDLRNIEKVRSEVGMVFQQFNLFPHLKVRDNVSLAPIWVRKKPKAEAEEQAQALLELVGIPEQADKFPGQLSGGQQQRVAIARCLAMNPKLMLLDEITSALDPELIAEVITVLEKVRKLDIAMLIITHEIQFARKSGDRVCFFYDGVILEEGAPDKIIDYPETEPAKRFFKAIL